VLCHGSGPHRSAAPCPQGQRLARGEGFRSKTRAESRELFKGRRSWSLPTATLEWIARSREEIS
jgi:hypothetical protein